MVGTPIDNEVIWCPRAAMSCSQVALVCSSFLGSAADNPYQLSVVSDI